MANIQSKGKITAQVNAQPEGGRSPLLPGVDVNSITDTWLASYVTQLNAGIVYGTNALPGSKSEFAVYMGGRTTGITASQVPDIGQRYSPITASAITNGFLTAARQWNSIRNTTWTYRIRRSGYSSGNGDIVQAGFPVTGISYLSSSYAINITQPAGGPQLGNPVVAASGTTPTIPYAPNRSPDHPASATVNPLLVYFQNLVAQTTSQVRNDTQSVDITVCHQSCHSSCHRSRGRR